MKHCKLFLMCLLVCICANAFAELKVLKKSIIASGRDLTLSPPSYAQNTSTGETLIAWCANIYSTNAAIYGTILNAEGKGSKRIVLVADSTLDGDFQIAYNSASNEYLLAYVTTLFIDQKHIVVQRFKADGKRASEGLIISHDVLTDPFNQNLLSKLLYYPETGGYILIWFVHAVNDIHGDSFSVRLILDKNAKPVSSLEKVSITPPPWLTDTGDYEFLFSASGRQIFSFGHVLTDVEDGSNYLLAKLNSTFTAATIQKINSKLVVDPLPGKDIRFLWGISLTFLPNLSGAAYFTDNSSVSGRLFNKEGKLTGASFKAFNPPKHATQMYWPDAAFINTTRGPRGIVIATDDQDLNGGSTTWAQVLNERGKPIGEPVNILSLSHPETIINGHLIALPHNGIDPFHRFVWLGFDENKSGAGLKIIRLDLRFVP